MNDTHIYPCLTPGRKNKRQNGPRFRGDGDEMFTLTAQDQHGIAEVREIMNSEKQKAERKDIKKAERYCEYCGKPLERKRFNGRLEDFGVFMKRSYCDRECMKRAYLKIGETDSDWSAAHGSARNINKLILKKDHCEICGRTENLDMHHIDGNWQNNNLDNLMCLCRSCHMKIERNDNKRKEGEHTNIRIRKLTPKECWRSINGFHR